jgi:hypothetical protein
MNIEQGLDFLLSHFQEPIWPRNVATAATNTKQYTVEDKARALLYYNAARKEDCRLSIYPNFERMAEMGYKNLGPNHVPDMLLIDIDADDRDMDNDPNAALKITLRNIKKQLNGAIPTVIWTGSGVHILQPLALDVALEDMPEFSRFRKNSTDLSVKFMRWAARRLSADRSDPNHNPSFKSCLTRVPGSINSKNGETVKILQRWNQVRAKPTKQFITDFLIALVQKEIEDKAVIVENVQKWKNPKNHNSGTTPWIERLLQTPIADYRKGARDLILIPYLVVRRGLEPNQVYDIVLAWAKECNKLKPLEPSYTTYSNKVRTRIKEVVKAKIPPMTWAKLLETRPDIAELLIKNQENVNNEGINIRHSNTMTNMETDNHESDMDADEFEAEIENSQGKNRQEEEDDFLSTYIRLEDGKTKAVRVNADQNKRKVVTRNIKGHDVKAMIFMAEDLEEEPGIEKELRATSKNLARKIVSYLKHGVTDLEITKHGSTGFGVTYDVKAINEPQTVQQGKQKHL